MKNMLNEFFGSVGAYLPTLLAALAVLIIGWIIAMVIAGIIRGVLRRIGMNRWISSWTKTETREKMPDIENGVAKGAYFLIMLFVLIAFFQTLRITLITEPLTIMLNQLFQFAPQLLGAFLLLVTAWIVAKLCQIGVRKILTAIKIDERLGQRISTEQAEEKPVALSKSLADAVYGVVLLLFLPAILDALSLEGLLTPIQSMINKILSFLPNLITAGIIFLVGWFVARLVQQIVTNLLVAIGTDTFSEKVGLAQALGNQKLSSVCGFILYAFMLIPVAIAGLNTLQLDSITQPASNMLNLILSSLPNIFAAVLIVVIGFIIGRLVSGMVTNLLAGIGFDSITARLGFSQEKTEKTMLPSRAIGYLTMVIILFFATLEACSFLGFTALTQLLNQFMLFAGHVLFGVIIFAIGLLAANTVHKIVLSARVEKASFMASAARVAILIFAGAMALRQMGLANDIINLAFGLLLGTIALSTSIAFGIGARDIAGRELEGWITAIKSKKK